MAEEGEASPLIPINDQVQSHTRSRLGALVGTLALVAIGAVVGLDKTAPTSKSELSSETDKPAKVYLYKRTTPSAEPERDCIFMANVVGAQCSVASIEQDANDPANGDTCGVRSASTTGMFSFHNLKDKFEPVGDVATWVDRINAAHGATFNDGGTGMEKKWDAFMSLNMGFFTADLSAHVNSWLKSNQRFRAHWYKNPVDGETMYYLATYNPTNGNVMEIHSSSLADEDLLNEHFTEIPADVCTLALSLGHSMTDLMAQWNDAIAKGYTALGDLPYSTLVKISHPTMDADKAAAWMSDNALIADFRSPYASADGNCRVASALVDKYIDVGKAHIMFVEDTRTAYKEEMKQVAMFIDHVTNVHDTRMGTQRGWDRWIDNHIGLVYFDKSLDQMAPNLVHNGVKFHAIRDIYKTDSFCQGAATGAQQALCGSIWAAGPSGLSVEMHAFFSPDHEFFGGDFSPTFMDFCNGETNKGTTDMFDDTYAQSDW